MQYLKVNESEAHNIISQNNGEISGYEFVEVNFSEFNIKNLIFWDCQFVNCMIREADFAGANISKGSFYGSNLSGTSFSNTNLEKCDLRTARGYFIDPRITKIKEAKFSFPDAITLIEAMGATVEI